MYSTVLVTAPDLEISKTIARTLVEKKLAACANIFPITSIFSWKDRIEEEDEVAMLLKIRSENFDLVKMEVVKMHPYEVPCIVRYDIVEGNRPYLDWISRSTRN